MNEYTPDTMDDVRLVLRGLHQNMRVEIDRGIPLAAKTVWDLRARHTWPPGLRLVVSDKDRPDRVVKVERRE